MNALSLIFETKQAHTVRMVIDDSGAPWWIAVDVCGVLGLSNSRKALSALDEDEKGVTSGYTLGGNQHMATVNESGLYSLIFKSRKPEAKAFRRWVTCEVLPQIRRTGQYSRDAAEIQRALRFYRALSESRDTASLCDIGRMSGIGRNTIMSALRDKGILDKRNLPYQRFVDSGYFRVIEKHWEDSKGHAHIVPVCRVTLKGIEWLIPENACDPGIILPAPKGRENKFTKVQN